jgi:hypothetical protein
MVPLPGYRGVPKKYPDGKNPYGPVAQGIEQQPSKLKVAGSNPAGVANKISGFLHLRPMISALKIAWGGMGAERKWPA